jgi:hypothetical protein
MRFTGDPVLKRSNFDFFKNGGWGMILWYIWRNQVLYGIIAPQYSLLRKSQFFIFQKMGGGGPRLTGLFRAYPTLF